MNNEITNKLKHLNDDYEKLKGHRFSHFFCPILFKDEITELCKGHIVNQAFSNSPRAWTVQRKDVDGFYGHNFEADFTALEYRIAKLTPDRAILDSKFSNKLKPKILVDGQQVDYFISNRSRQSDFTRMEIESNSTTAEIVLKMRPEDVESALGANWEIEINKDIKLQSLVSLIKAAHLTLFEILGYFYALSSGGYFVGRQILGEFYFQNKNKASKPEVLENANSFFKEFINMVRPVESFAYDLKGTVTDKILFVCKNQYGYWSFIVFIRTSEKLHSVMIPNFDKPEKVATFTDFLKTQKEIHLSGNFCRFDKSKNQWEIDKKSHELIWPQSGFIID